VLASGKANCQYCAHGYSLSSRNQNAGDGPLIAGLDGYHRFVRLDLKYFSPRLDIVALADQPLDDSSFFHGQAQLGHCDLEWHMDPSHWAWSCVSSSKLSSYS
jgi:hypothetical protein